MDVNDIAQCANKAGEMIRRDLRRLSLSELLYLLQDIKLDNFYHPGADGQNKSIYEARVVREIEQELKRRQGMTTTANNSLPNTSIIASIKERADIADIVSQFTDVFVESRKWIFRCPLHSDEHPSGHIYKSENQVHCFQCNFHGDVIDVVSNFGKLPVKDAIHWLAKYYGLQTDILPAQKPKGGISLATTTT